MDFNDLDKEIMLVVCEKTIDFLKIEKPVSGKGEYVLKLTSSDSQKDIIKSYIKNITHKDLFTFFNALVCIQPRKTLRYERMQVL